jgi:hypothetical protein
MRYANEIKQFWQMGSKFKFSLDSGDDLFFRLISLWAGLAVDCELKMGAVAIIRQSDSPTNALNWWKFWKIIWPKINKQFPPNQIAYLLFLAVVKLLSSENARQMRYANEIKQFWQMGSKLFHGKFLLVYVWRKIYFHLNTLIWLWGSTPGFISILSLI